MPVTLCSPLFCRDRIKFLAILLMTCNHIAVIFLKPETLLYAFLTGIGYFTAICMCFFLTEGFSYTRSRLNYGGRLFLFSLLSQPPYMLAFSSQHPDGCSVFRAGSLNMIVTLLLCFLILCIRSAACPAPVRIALISFLFLFSEFCDWGMLAPIFVLLFYESRRRRIQPMYAWLLSCGLILLDSLPEALSLSETVPLALLRLFFTALGPAAAAICCLFLYDGKKERAVSGKIGTYFFYCYYPLHLLLLGLLSRSFRF